MRKMIKRVMDSNKLNKYCVNVLRMYNIGRVNLPV